MNEQLTNPPINLGDRVLYDDSDRPAVVLAYRPYPKPCYGVMGNVPSPDFEYLYMTGPDGIARMYFVRWVPEDKLKPFREIQKESSGAVGMVVIPPHMRTMKRNV